MTVAISPARPVTAGTKECVLVSRSDPLPPVVQAPEPEDGVTVTAVARNSLDKALQDVAEGLALWRLWTRLGWNDIVQRYRRSLLGPFWLTASMGVMVIGLGVVYGQIFGVKIDDFIPFLCTGLLTWGFVSSILNEAGDLFTGSASHIKQVRLPYSLYAHRFVWSKIIVFAHNAVIYVAVLAYFQFWPGAAALYAIPGFAALVVNAVLVSLYLGMISARFRDVPQIVTSVTQIIFLMTPILWKEELLGPRIHLANFNPFFHLIEIVRSPLLGQLPSQDTVVAVSLITIFNFVIAAIVFIRFRGRIAYWV